MENRPAPTQATVLAYQSVGAARSPSALDGDSEPSDTLENARLSMFGAGAAVISCWIPLIGLIPAFLAIIAGVDAWRKAVRPKSLHLAMIGTVLGMLVAAVQCLMIGFLVFSGFDF